MKLKYTEYNYYDYFYINILWDCVEHLIKKMKKKMLSEK